MLAAGAPRTSRILLASALAWTAALPAGVAAGAASHGGLAGIRILEGRPLLLLLGLGALSLLPFVFVLATSFLKISVVLSFARTAFGAPQVPPNSVVTGLAAILSLLIMAPVGRAMWRVAAPDLGSIGTAGSNGGTEGTARALWSAGVQAVQPLEGFLERNAHRRDLAVFLDLARQTRPASERTSVGPHDLLVVLPAFVTSQLKEAFEIAFLLFLPFLVIDLVVSNVLLALGMHMLSPTTVSLPLKLLVFVVADGWLLLVRGLVAGYH